jgi:nanoRNase/pAp phosphatase (c-di-AMP/oligoRNAs hydrolase)
VDPKNIYVFTDIDLDGSTSLLALHWALNAKPGELQYKSTTVSNVRRDLLKWLETDSFKNYSLVYFLDLDTTKCADLIDHSNVVIIDHHATHVAGKDVYKLARVNIVVGPSCSKLIYQHFKGTIQITDAQKYLIGLANDYDSYTFKLSESYDLNCLYTSIQKFEGKVRVERYIERFYEGFGDFNIQEKNIIKDYITKRDKAISELKIYTGKLPIGKEVRKLAGTFGTKYVNDICDMLLKKYGADIVFFVNVDNKHVSFRKAKTCDVDLSKLATKICNGGGHEYAAGGIITDAFLRLTEQLTFAETQ